MDGVKILNFTFSRRLIIRLVYIFLTCFNFNIILKDIKSNRLLNGIFVDKSVNDFGQVNFLVRRNRLLL